MNINRLTTLWKIQKKSYPVRECQPPRRGSPGATTDTTAWLILLWIDLSWLPDITPSLMSATCMHAVCVYMRIRTIIFELKVWGLNRLARKTSQIQSFYLSIVLFPSMLWSRLENEKSQNILYNYDPKPKENRFTLLWIDRSYITPPPICQPWL